MNHQGKMEKSVYHSDNQGVIALCSLGILGLITEPHKREVTYPDGNKGVAYVGVGLFTGKPWSSRAPEMIGRFGDFMESYCGNGSLISGNVPFLEWCKEKLGGKIPPELT